MLFGESQPNQMARIYDILILVVSDYFRLIVLAVKEIKDVLQTQSFVYVLRVKSKGSRAYYE